MAVRLNSLNKRNPVIASLRNRRGNPSVAWIATATPWPRNDEVGFTLMEVLVALVILALGFSSMYLSLGTATRHLFSIQNKTAAEWVGLNINAKARLGVLDPNSNRTGTEKMFLNTWNWKLEVEPTENPSISRLVTIVSGEGKLHSEVYLTGYVYESPIKQ